MDRLLKSISAITLSIICLFSFGCAKKDNPLIKNVTELRSDLYYGESQSYKVKGAFGYRTENGDRIYALTIKLINVVPDQTEYVVYMKYGDQTLESKFELNPVTNSLTAMFLRRDFCEKEFEITISHAGESETVLMKSEVPEGTASYTAVLDELNNSQAELLKNYYENGEFCGDIILRLTVKNEKPYWYVGICKDKNLKAFLMDGKTLEVLAIREIF